MKQSDRDFLTCLMFLSATSEVRQERRKMDLIWERPADVVSLCRACAEILHLALPTMHCRAGGKKQRGQLTGNVLVRLRLEPRRCRELDVGEEEDSIEL